MYKSLFLALIFVFMYSPFSAYSVELMSTNKISEVMKRIKSEFHEEINENDIVISSLKCLMSNLDKHSSYLTESEYEKMQMDTKGQLEGVGLELIDDNGLIRVIEVLSDSPADRAGIHAGDVIISVDGEYVEDIKFTNAVQKIRGSAGTTVSMLVRRDDNIIEVNPIRSIIKTNFITSDFRDGIVYIRVSFFAEGLSDLIKKEIASFFEKNANFEAIIIDLRGNPGGLLSQAVELCDLLLEDGKDILYVRSKKKRNNQTYRSGGQINSGIAKDLLSVYKEVPLVILINEGSASASEIVAGALQDNKRATVVGKKSFGKGSVQKLISLGKSNGAIKITSAVYYTPSNKIIQGVGVEPDVVLDYENKCISSHDTKTIYECDSQLVGAIDIVRKMSIFKH